MSFGNDISKFVDKTEGKMEKVVKMSFIQLSANVIRRSPVGNPSIWKGSAPKGYAGGRFRANWQASIGSPVSGEVDSTSASVATGSVINATKRFGDYYLMNNLPYAKRLEEGHSRQASDGIVKLAVAEWSSIVRIITGLVK
mgnify:FL=1